MIHTFKEHLLSDAERIWLAEAAQERFSPPVSKVRLLGQLPDDFDPSKINKRLYVSNRLTLVGRWHVDPTDPIFAQIDQVIRTIRKQIIDNPGIESITTSAIARTTGLPEDRVGQVFNAFVQLGDFYCSATGSNNSLVSLSLVREDHDTYDEYLRYKSVDDLLERFYLRQGQGRADRNFLDALADVGDSRAEEGVSIKDLS